MNKYNKGDKFILEVDYLITGTDGNMYYKMNLDNIMLNAEKLDKLQKCETELSWDEAYIKGLEDAWGLAKKLWHNDARTNDDIYGIEYFIDIANDYTPQEALAKLEAYEKAKEIKVGNVVEATDFCGDVFKGTVLDFKVGAETEVFVLDENGCVDVWKIADCKKTGKHIEINNILEQIRGD